MYCNSWLLSGFAFSCACNILAFFCWFKVEWDLRQEDRDVLAVRALFNIDRNQMLSVLDVQDRCHLNAMRAHMALKALLLQGFLEVTRVSPGERRIYYVTDVVAHSSGD